jgi:hypothetical protein
MSQITRIQILIFILTITSIAIFTACMVLLFSNRHEPRWEVVLTHEACNAARLMGVKVDVGEQCVLTAIEIRSGQVQLQPDIWLSTEFLIGWRAFAKG